MKTTGDMAGCFFVYI